MPGLARGIARTAVVAGTATAVSGRVARRQASRYTEKDAQLAADRTAAYQRDMGYNQPPPQYAPAPQQQYAPAPAQYAAPAPAPAVGQVDIEQLKQLGDLHANGILSDAEFAQAKAKVLGA
ncbi:MAG TPA: SHOCT domain-containing protein [Ilumatobacteraceae bacterium]|nr:SHOCT domain-containing protein [Ilumatobacteraceae bacterium]